MAISDLNEMMQQTIEKLKKMMSEDSIVGEPITAEGATIVPISKLSFGFVTGGYDMKSKSVKLATCPDDQPIAAIGGGVSVNPIGFLVLSKDYQTFIKTQGDNTDKWLDIVQSTIRKVIKL